jgi:hypothetical protein
MEFEVTAMLNRVLIGACLSLSLIACATTPAGPGTAKPPAAVQAAPVQTLGCARPDNGTRLPATAPNCSGPASVYSKSDIDRTGQADTGDALRMLSPSLTVH